MSEIINDKNNQQLNIELPNEWNDNDNDNHNEEGYRYKWSISLVFLSISFIIFLVSAIYFGISYYNKNNSISSDNILINLNINKSIDSTIPNIANISVTNYNKLSLNGGKIKIEYQAGKKKNGDYNIVREEILSGNIAYNNTFSTNTRFVFYGIEGENRGIKITFEYTLSNGQIFKKSFNDSVSIYKSALNMEVVPNQKSATIIENNKYAFTVKVKNISQEELNNPILSIILPRSFILDRNSEFKDSNNIKLNSIKQGESKNFNFSGYFSELSSDDRVFRAVLYTDTNILLKDAILEAKNIKAPFSLEINYIKDFTEIQDIKRKTPYELKLSLHNNSEDPYTNIFVNFKDSNLEKRLNINPLSIGVDRTEYVSVDIVTPDYDEYQFNMLVTGRKKGIFEDDVLLSRNITTQLLK